MLQQNTPKPSNKTGIKQEHITPYYTSWCTKSGHCSLKSGSMIAGSGAQLPLETGPMQSFTASTSSGVPPFQFSTTCSVGGTSMHFDYGSQSSPRGDKYTSIDHRQPRQQKRAKATKYRGESSSGSSSSEDSSKSDDSYLLSRKRAQSSKTRALQV